MYKITFTLKKDGKKIAVENLPGFPPLLLFCVEKGLNFKSEGLKATIMINEGKGEISIIYQGVSPTTESAFIQINQAIRQNLDKFYLNELFDVDLSQTSYSIQAGNITIDPILDVPPPNYPQLMFATFGVKADGLSVPRRFICPITGKIMNEPVYLETNPKVFYERQAIITWVKKNHTDPTTREQVTLTAIIDAPQLQSEIYKFVSDVVNGKDLASYYEDEEVELKRSASASASFFPRPPVEEQPAALSQVMQACLLGEEFKNLGAKALRRAAKAGRLDFVTTLIQQYGKEIINLHDSNPDSLNTAMHYAVEKNHVEIVRYLLEQGGRMDISNAQNKTVTQLIEESTSEEMKSLLSASQSSQLERRSV